jgi:regulatory protein
MPTIVRLKLQKDKNKAEIFFEEGEKLAVSLETLFKKGLKKGQELSWEEIESLQEEGVEEKIYSQALRFLNIRPRSRREIELWFKRKLIIPKITERILTKLEKLKLIDDLAFAKFWIEQRSLSRPKGRRLISFELRQKGVAREIIDEAFANVEIPEEAELAKKLVEKKIRWLKNLPDYEAKQKLFAYLGRRGFGFGVIKKAIDEMFQK